jgi:septal ring factor EnvC (AmiA/AmiB activator)
MTGPDHILALGEMIRQWAPVVVTLMGGIAAWFSLAAKVDRLDTQHAEWRQQHMQAIERLTEATDRIKTETQSLMIDFARITTAIEAMREELRRQNARQDRIEQNRGDALRERH